MLILKRHLVLYVERLGYEFAAIFVKFVCISCFTSQICINRSLCIFLKPRCVKVIFQIIMIVCINLVVNYVFF